jgi:protein DGCR14
MQVPLNAKLSSAEGVGTTPTGTPHTLGSVHSNHSTAAPEPSTKDDLPKGAILAPFHTVGEFAARHTSDDQQSIEEIFAADASRRKVRYAWAHSESRRTDVQTRPAVERITGAAVTDGFGTAGQKPSTLIGWHHVPKSHLFYTPEDSLELSAAEKSLMPIGEAPVTHARNTRFPSKVEEATGVSVEATPSTIPDTISASPTASSSGGRGMSEAGQTPRSAKVAQIGGLRGYTSVATPTPSPAMLGVAPMMTWGELDGTPMVLDREIPGAGNIEDMGGKPFVGAQLSKRELAARKATRNVAGARTHKRQKPCVP